MQQCSEIVRAAEWLDESVATNEIGAHFYSTIVPNRNRLNYRGISNIEFSTRQNSPFLSPHFFAAHWLDFDRTRAYIRAHWEGE
jgi:hypothetical protein